VPDVIVNDINITAIAYSDRLDRRLKEKCLKRLFEAFKGNEDIEWYRELYDYARRTGLDVTLSALHKSLEAAFEADAQKTTDILHELNIWPAHAQGICEACGGPVVDEGNMWICWWCSWAEAKYPE